MKNYTCGWYIEEQGYIEVSEDDYTLRQIDMREFIKVMSTAIELAKCGWSSVKYKVMRHIESNDVKEYMILYTGIRDVRWIPITGNSKGCNFSVLGENLW